MFLHVALYSAVYSLCTRVVLLNFAHQHLQRLLGVAGTPFHHETELHHDPHALAGFSADCYSGFVTGE